MGAGPINGMLKLNDVLFILYFPLTAFFCAFFGSPLLLAYMHGAGLVKNSIINSITKLLGSGCSLPRRHCTFHIWSVFIRSSIFNR